jgi:sortase A
MRNKLGTVLILFGIALLLAASILLLHNSEEDAHAGLASGEVLPQLVQQIEHRQETVPADPTPIIPSTPVELLTPEQVEMPEAELNGNRYIGYLAIPKLELELPVMSEWSYPLLLQAPCRYTGTLLGEDLTIMAHNYNSHFGRLGQMEAGDEVIFVDVNGKVTRYAVTATDVLLPTAVEEVTSGAYDLTLFTCTYGGQSRITVYCDKTQ